MGRKTKGTREERLMDKAKGSVSLTWQWCSQLVCVLPSNRSITPPTRPRGGHSGHQGVENEVPAGPPDRPAVQNGGLEAQPA